MIFDAIIVMIEAILVPVASFTGSIVIAVVNLILAAIEAVIGIFISGFSLTRMSKKQPNSKSRSIEGGMFFGVALLVVGVFFLVLKVLNRTVTFVAEDGHSLPFAAVIVSTSRGSEHERADKSGKLTLARFGVESVTMKDPRYIGKTWTGLEIEDKLIAERTILGSGLDSFAEKWLKKSMD